MVSIIERRISVPPSKLDYNIKESILQIAKNTFENKCSKDEGYIIQILKLNKILGNKVSVGGECIFKVNLEAKVLKPEKDKVFKSIICMIFPNGVLVEIEEKMKALIPIDKMGDFKLSEDYSNISNDKITLEKGDEVNIELYDFKYSKHNFNCLGVLKV